MVGEEEHSIDQEKLDEEREEQLEDQMDLDKETQDAYGYPTPDPTYNQHAIISKAAFDGGNSVKTTFLSEQELGRPLFSVRFMLDLQKIAEHQGLLRISQYFEEKINSITDSGMSNGGFMMNLAATQKKDIVKKKMRDTSGLKNQKEVRRQKSYGY